MDYLALTLPGQSKPIQAPAGVPTGGIDKIGQILGNGLGFFILIVIVISLFMLVYSGLQWVSSNGDKTKIDAARKRITWAITGLVITFLTYFILNGIGFMFGINLFDIGR